MSPMTLGKRLHALRKKKRVTLKEMAKAIGVSIGAISEWEKDKNEPNPVNRKKAAEYLGVTEAELMGGPHADKLHEAMLRDYSEADLKFFRSMREEMADNPIGMFSEIIAKGAEELVVKRYGQEIIDALTDPIATKALLETHRLNKASKSGACIPAFLQWLSEYQLMKKEGKG